MADARRVNFRIDVRQEILGQNADGSYAVRITPDPDRYELVDEGGKRYYRDRYSHLSLSEERMFESIKRALTTLELRADFANDAVSDPAKYVESRRAAIESFLKGQGAPTLQTGKTQRELLETMGAGIAYSIVTVDIHNALDFTNSEAPIPLIAVLAVLSHELGLAAAMHNGTLWQSSVTTLSFFFAAPNLISKVDLSLGFATMARQLIIEIDKQLNVLGSARLQCGVAIEAGEAFAQLIGMEAVHTAVSLVGSVVAVAEALARLTPESSLWVGPRAADLSHISWRKLMRPVDPAPPLNVEGDFERSARVFELDKTACGSGPLLFDQDTQ